VYYGLRHFAHYWKPLYTAETYFGVNWMYLIAVSICFVVNGDSAEMIACGD
jgi:hypothetical protein